MSISTRGNVTRDGFTCSSGRFLTHPDHTERVEGSSLRAMFLPNLTPEGCRLLDADYSRKFVRGQLKHYGVQFEERDFSGNGTRLLKKVLQDGKCDKVPDQLAELREQMHAEWLNKCTPDELSSHPEWVMEKYFLSSGRPDPTKTTMAVGISLPRDSSYRASQMWETASKVAGLHQETKFGSNTQTIFMGWDSAAVSRAAEGQAAKEAKELRAAENERQEERAEMHTNYLDTLKKKKGPKDRGPKTYSPIGRYIVDCKEIEGQWPDQADDLRLDIHQTEEPGIFEASFDFGILEGIMIISADKNTLEQYCSQLDREAEFDGDEGEEEGEDEDEDEAEDNKKPSAGSKRKAKTPQGRGRPAKKSKIGVPESRTYLLRLKCRETGEGEIQSTAKSGSIKFKDEKLTSFMGKATLPFVGQNIPFSARKISDVPDEPGDSWADYSESAYESAQTSRW